MNESNLEDLNSILDSDNLHEFDGLLFNSEELSYSSNEEESEGSEDNLSSYYDDIVVILTSMESDVSSINSSLASLNEEQLAIVNGISVIEENSFYIICFMIVFTIFAVIKICFAIFNKVLGLGQA